MANNWLDFGTFQTIANQYADILPNVHTTVDNIQQAVVDAKAGWKGDANDAFNTFMTGLLGELQSVNRDLTAVSEALSAGEKVIANADGESTTGFTSLKAGYASTV